LGKQLALIATQKWLSGKSRLMDRSKQGSGPASRWRAGLDYGRISKLEIRVGVTLAGGAYMVESSSADGRDATPSQGALFQDYACSTCQSLRFWGAGIHWNGKPYKLTN